MSEQSQKAEMNAAIRAQRERHNVPRTIAPEPDPVVVAAPPAPSEPAPPPTRPRGLVARLLGR